MSAEGPVFLVEQYQRTLQANRQLVDQRSPGSQLWVLAQSFGFENGPHADDPAYRMPTPDEMKRLYEIAAAERVDGFLWYPWQHNLYTQVLADAEMAPQRAAMGEIYADSIASSQSPLSTPSQETIPPAAPSQEAAL